MFLRGVLRRRLLGAGRELTSIPRLADQRLRMDEAYREGVRHGKMGMKPAVSMYSGPTQAAYKRGFLLGVRYYKQGLTARYPVRPLMRKAAPVRSDAITYLQRTSKNLNKVLG